MAAKRVHQLAKELGVTSKELLEILQSMGENITNPLSSMSEDTEKALVKKIGFKKSAKEKKKTKTKDEKKAQQPKAKTEEKEGVKKGRQAATGASAVKQPPKTAKAPDEKAQRPRRETVKKDEVRDSGQAGSRPPGQKPALRKPEKKAYPQRPRPRRRESDKGVAAGKGRPRIDNEKAPKEPGTKPMKKKLRVPAGITVREFAQRVGRTPSEIISILMSMGEMITINQSISDDALLLVAEELGIEVEVKTKALQEAVIAKDEPETLKTRPPVVTVMGHVDHGKTSLLDAIRNTAVTEEERGGITQHIGASVVEFEGKRVTFIDTPGHESFTALRARGAQVTDLAVLVVAADDGVMPQTIEAIDHARAAGVPVMVVVNKIDRPDANPDKVRQQLTEFNLLPEEWGGETVYVDVSAKEGTNLDHLLEMILLLTEMQDYRANPDAPASGNIIEARLDRGRGPVATLLIKRGTLKRGDAVVAGKTYGRVRALMDDTGKVVEQAGPATPVEILGLNGVPQAGDEFVAVEDDKKARAIAENRINKERVEGDKKAVRSFSLEDLFQQIQAGEVQEFNLIVKGDTRGSVEAIKDSVDDMEVGDITINVIRTGVGAITENDIMLAKASSAVVIGFNVRPEPKANELAAKEKVDVRTYRVIYQLLEDLESALVGMLKPEYEEVQSGLLEVRAVFRVPRQGAIAGSLVKEGEINRNSKVRLVRDGTVVHEGVVASLKRFKDDVRSVSAGYECGVGLENYQDIKEGDLIEVIEMREVPRGGEAADS
ncbi:MAG: translation initiation factor IF-2 [Actinomycetota bacterium]|nr:translation initiation factor IF-2 [Actinomycetota bacterium]